MSFNWRDYHRLAGQLNSNPTAFGVDEAVFRCVTSRAYYSAFCDARNIAVAKHGLTWGRDDNIHRIVGEHFDNRTTKFEKRIGWRLSLLRRRRNQADYDDLIAQPDTPAGIASEALELARRILADLTNVR